MNINKQYISQNTMLWSLTFMLFKNAVAPASMTLVS